MLISYSLFFSTWSAHTTVNDATICLFSLNFLKYSSFVTVILAVFVAFSVVSDAIVSPFGAFKSVVESTSILNSFGT